MWGFPKSRGTILGVPIIRNYSILGSILGSPYFGKLPCGDFREYTGGMLGYKGKYRILGFLLPPKDVELPNGTHQDYGLFGRLCHVSLGQCRASNTAKVNVRDFRHAKIHQFGVESEAAFCCFASQVIT